MKINSKVEIDKHYYQKIGSLFPPYPITIYIVAKLNSKNLFFSVVDIVFESKSLVSITDN